MRVQDVDWRNEEIVEKTWKYNIMRLPRAHRKVVDLKLETPAVGEPLCVRMYAQHTCLAPVLWAGPHAGSSCQMDRFIAFLSLLLFLWF